MTPRNAEATTDYFISLNESGFNVIYHHTSGAFRPCAQQRTLMHERLKPHQAHGNLLVLLSVVFLSLFGLLGVYASERTISAQQRGFGKEVGANAASRKTLLWKGAEQIPRLLHRLELSGTGVLVCCIYAKHQMLSMMSPTSTLHGALHVSRGLLGVPCGPAISHWLILHRKHRVAGSRPQPTAKAA